MAEQESKRTSQEATQQSNDTSQGTFDEAFELTGNGRFNMAVMLTCGIINLCCVMELMGISYVITAATCELDLTDQHKGMLTASGFIGIVGTSVIWGYLGDTYGRRGVMLPALVISAVLSIISAFSINFWMLFILRIVVGCMVSASNATVFAYLGELQTSAHRAKAIAQSAIALPISYMLLPALAWIIIPGKWNVKILSNLSFVPWRLFMLTWPVTSLAAAISLFLLPESPKYILSRKGPDDALKILSRMYASNNKKTPESFPVKKITLDSNNVYGIASLGTSLRRIGTMFKPPLLLCVVVSYLCMFSLFLVASGMFMWTPDIFNSYLEIEKPGSLCVSIMAYGQSKNKKIENMPFCMAEVSLEMFPLALGMGVIMGVFFVLVSFIIQRVNKLQLYSGALSVSGLMMLGAGLVPQGGVGMALLALALVSGCTTSVLTAIVVEVFPTEIRAMAMCVLYMVGRIGSATGSSILGAMLHHSCVPAFILFAVLTWFSAAIILLWPNPTKVKEEMMTKGFRY